MVLTGLGTTSIDYSRRLGAGAMHPEGGESILVPIPTKFLKILTASSKVGTGRAGRNPFGHMGKLYIQTDGPGTQGGTSSILILRSSSSCSSSCSSSSSSSLSSSSSSLST